MQKRDLKEARDLATGGILELEFYYSFFFFLIESNENYANYVFMIGRHKIVNGIGRWRRRLGGRRMPGQW